MIERSISTKLKSLAKQYPVVTLTGPRQSGKTTLCRSIFNDYDYVNLENIDVRLLAQEDPRGFLQQFSTGVVLDEIQRVPDLVSYIQGIVDETDKPGQFILTGSQQFEISNSINQSLAGRTAILRLLPFSYNELYNNKRVSLNEVLYAGFYPRIHDKKLNPTEALSFYVNTYVERDLREMVNIKDLQVFDRFLKICASNVGQIVNYTRISNDCGISLKTVQSWISILEANYILFLLPPHFSNFRKRVTKSPKLYFYDVGLVAYLLGISSTKHINSHPLKGHLFESFIISEFLKSRYNRVQQNNLYYFRDNNGNEVDLILDFSDRFSVIEIKSSATISSQFFKGLNYYSKINNQVSNKYLVYSGEHKSKFTDIQIVPYNFISESININ